ncbi:hypothetical protein B0H13DRAFT_1886819 [Mycena leptocephala]|nr:hypothetical protein B0H13DRAFT_1886819 [Mycena leptocephala]
MAQLDGLVCQVTQRDHGVPVALQLEHKFIKLLLGVDQNKEALGTIQDAAAYERTGSRVLPGSVADPAERIKDDVMQMELVQYYNRDGPRGDINHALQAGLCWFVPHSDPVQWGAICWRNPGYISPHAAGGNSYQFSLRTFITEFVLGLVVKASYLSPNNRIPDREY